MAVKSCADADKISRRISMFSMKSLFFYIPYFIQISCSFYLKKISMVLCYNYQFADFLNCSVHFHTHRKINKLSYKFYFYARIQGSGVSDRHFFLRMIMINVEFLCFQCKLRYIQSNILHVLNNIMFISMYLFNQKMISKVTNF